MIKYMLKEPYYVGDTMSMSGDMFEIKKLKHPVTLSGKKFKYKEVNTGGLFKDKKSIKQHFTKGTYKSETPKQILKLLLTLALYELSKEITYEVICRMQAKDMVPKDYEEEK